MRVLPALIALALLTGCATTTAENAAVEIQDTEVEISQAETDQDMATEDESEQASQSEQTATPEETEPAASETKTSEQQSVTEQPVTTPAPAPATTPAPEPAPAPAAAEPEVEEVQPEPEPEVVEPAGYTMTQVRANNTTSSCWAAVNGNVYDLTGWVSRHPGGSGAISRLCGTDATSAFSARHGNQTNPNNTLASYLLGPLAG